MGSLTLLGGAADETPLADAPILIQVREVTRKGEVVNERTIAQVSTDTAGTWSLLVTLAPSAGGITLRALCPGASGVPAAVSAALHVSGAVSVA